jgi:hypothetical protein
LAPLPPTGFRGEIPAGLLVPTATTVLQATPVVRLADGEALLYYPVLPQWELIAAFRAPDRSRAA